MYFLLRAKESELSLYSIGVGKKEQKKKNKKLYV